MLLVKENGMSDWSSLKGFSNHMTSFLKSENKLHCDSIPFAQAKGSEKSIELLLKGLVWGVQSCDLLQNFCFDDTGSDILLQWNIVLNLENYVLLNKGNWQQFVLCSMHLLSS